MTSRLVNKKVIITGGTTGIGFTTAKRYIDEGAKLLITGRSQERIDRALSELGSSATGIVADSTKIDQLTKLAEKAKQHFSEVDILFVNAGGGVFVPIADIDEAHYDKQFDLNVKSVFFTVQKLLPLLKKGSSIILTASAVSEKGAAGGSLYFATKAAVRSLARSLATELGPLGIRVNSLSPGLIPTKFFANSNMGQAGYDHFAELITTTAPLGREGKPEEIANAAVFLGSDESSYMTAENLVVDGGWSNV